MSLITRNIFRKILQAYPNVSARNIHASAALATTDIQERPDSRVKCTLIPGDGVGPELAESVMDVFQAADVPVDFEFFNLSEVAPIMSAKLEDVIASITRNRVCLKGVLQTPDFNRFGELQTLNMKMRTDLDLYANVVHIKSLQGVNSRHQNVDCVIIREQTEGEYSALEYEGVKGVVECLKIITGQKSLRIAKFAFDYATKNKRKKVTAVHKANIMKLGDGLFLRSCEEIAKLYPKIQFEKMIVDNTTMQMVSNPQQFDVMVTPNLYGNILDNLASGLVGGAGVVAGASYSADCVIFEPGAKHAFTKGAGKGIANPTAMILCAAKLLAHVNLPAYSEQIRSAVYSVIAKGAHLTKDMGGQSTTPEFTNAVIKSLQPLKKPH